MPKLKGVAGGAVCLPEGGLQDVGCLRSVSRAEHRGRQGRDL